MVSEGAKLVDVRSSAEFATGHLPGAINVPVQELASRLSALGSKDQVKLLYCASGTRSAMARSMLKRHGFTRVFNLGAMSRW
ncbi:MAG: rhodanese-like domain-containing protein [Archangiaceae bacterium]|nr:rhodanese-like domain-containing protein [Archangiaceae bacterium]